MAFGRLLHTNRPVRDANPSSFSLLYAKAISKVQQAETTQLSRDLHRSLLHDEYYVFE